MHNIIFTYNIISTSTCLIGCTKYECNTIDQTRYYFETCWGLYKTSLVSCFKHTPSPSTPKGGSEISPKSSKISNPIHQLIKVDLYILWWTWSHWYHICKVGIIHFKSQPSTCLKSTCYNVNIYADTIMQKWFPRQTKNSFSTFRGSRARSCFHGDRCMT